MKYTNFKAIYFDMGGVLMDVLPGYSREKAIRYALSGPLMQEFLRNDFDMAQFIRFTDEVIAERSALQNYVQEDSYRQDRVDFERFLGSGVPFEVFREKFWRQIAYMTECFVLNPRAQSTLESIRRKGFIIGLISNVFHPAIVYKEMFTKWGIIDYFNPLVFSSEYRFKKPHRSIFEYALSWHPTLEASEAIFVGDTWTIDIEGARDAGLRPVWIKADYEGDECKGVPVIPDIGEITQILD